MQNRPTIKNKAAMNFVIMEQDLVSMLEAWLWPFFRVAGLLMTAPVIGTKSVPIKIRLILALAITVVIVPLVPPLGYIDPFSFQGVLISVYQVFIGLAMGTAVRVVFVVLELAGQLIGQLMGLMMASMVDPQNGNQVPIIGQFYLLLATLLFLGLDGHLIMIQSLANSFHQLPVGMQGISSNALWEMLNWFSSIFSAAVLIALPAVTSLLIVNLAFGVMTRAAPQLNIFAVGFPIMIILGIVIVMSSLTTFVPQMSGLFDDAFLMMDQLIRN